MHPYLLQAALSLPGFESQRMARIDFLKKFVYTVGGPFLRPFLHGSFFARFLLLRKCKKGTPTNFRRKNDENFGFFIWVIFLQKREIFAYFCLYFQIFYVLTPGANVTQGPWGKFGLFLFSLLSATQKRHFDKNLTHLWELISEL